MVKSGEKWLKVAKSGGKVVESGEKLGKVAISDEKRPLGLTAPLSNNTLSIIHSPMTLI